MIINFQRLPASYRLSREHMIYHQAGDLGQNNYEKQKPVGDHENVQRVDATWERQQL